MILYSDGKVTIRDLVYEDIASIVREELEQGWSATEEKYSKRLKDRDHGKSIALVALFMGQAAGYVNVYFREGTPMIVDFGVLEKYQGKGVGTKLMDIAEEIAFQTSDTVHLAVGLHSGYGKAQRMYVKRGYIPDGNGIWYGDSLCTPYESYPNDDNLVLRFSKKRTSL